MPEKETIPVPIPDKPKPNWLVIGLAVLSVGLLATTSFLFYQNQQLKTQLQQIQQPKASPSVAPTPTPIVYEEIINGWQVYIDSRYDFAIRHPSDWFMRAGGDPVILTNYDPELAPGKGGGFGIDKIKMEINLHEDMNYEKAKLKTIEDLDKKVSRDVGQKIVSQDDITIAGQLGVKYLHKFNSPIEPVVEILFPDNQKGFFRILIRPANSEYMPMVNQILSTFKFLDQEKARERIEIGFDLDKVKVGDKIDDMTVKTVEAFVENSGPTAENAKVVFEGQITITGIYHHDSEGLLPEQIRFDNLDDISLRKIPRILGDERVIWFLFENKEFAKTVFGSQVEESGEATIVIDNYTINSYPSEVWNTAKLVKVLD